VAPHRRTAAAKVMNCRAASKAGTQLSAADGASDLVRIQLRKGSNPSQSSVIDIGIERGFGLQQWRVAHAQTDSRE
jgi:hypothetical protein